MSAKRLDGRVALVTGSSSGIGAEVARSLAGEGATVVVNSRSSTESGEAVAKEVGGTYRQADVCDPESARQLISSIAEDLGRLDILVNNAGTTRVIPHGDLEAATPEIWAHIYATNVIAPFVLTTAARPHLASAPDGGVVVNIGSLAGIRPTGSSIPYAASKAALHHQTRLLAAVLGPEIRVNAVAPGLVETPWTEDWHEAHAGIAAISPMRRVAKPADVAHLVLAQVTSTLVTGEVWVVDSGLQVIR
ncbi:MAG TPA: SDR family oxidoreductase [Acidimicrobiales bacterium]|nr:SDR family oxidoreductase [Acidimicrobiales bacterium]